MTSKVTYVFAGGGTGGHLFPGIAVAHQLLADTPEARIVFVGSSREIESMIVREYHFEHQVLPVEPSTTLRRNAFRFLWQNARACRQASRLLRELQPTAIIGLGGFASAPLVWAARRLKLPIVLMEQNVIPGRTTRWLSRFADRICVSFEQTRARLNKGCNVIMTGNPIRENIATLQDRTEQTPTEPGDSTLRLLVLGGSQGAESLNNAVVSAMRQLASDRKAWTIVHQSGSRQAAQISDAYLALGITAVVEPFFREMANMYSQADMVVSRAGATTLAELACAGLPMILLPYPQSADDHQHANAQVFVDQGAAILIEHASRAEDTATSLAQAMTTLATDSERRRQMAFAARGLARPEAARSIANVIIQSVVGKNPHQR